MPTMRLKFYCGSLAHDSSCPEVWEVEASTDEWALGNVESPCPSCGSIRDQHEILDRGMPLAVCLLDRNFSTDMVLAVSRRDNYDAFGLPGGKVDPEDGETTPDAIYETLKRAIVREAWEELGCRLDPDTLTMEFQFPDASGYWNVCFSVPEGTALDDPGQPKSGEGIIRIVTWDRLEQGPFGDFNRRLHSHIWEQERWFRTDQPEEMEVQVDPESV